MTIDKQKLQKLLWSEVASWKADCGEWKQNAEALGEFLGEKTVEEVALELLAENEALRKALDAAAGRMIAAKECFDRDCPGEWSGELHLAVAIKEIDAAMSKAVHL